MRRTFWLLALCALLLPGCSDEKQPPPPKLFESQRNAMDKAKALEDAVQQQADQQREQIDQQTQQ